MARAGLKVVSENKMCSVYQNERCTAQRGLRNMHYYPNTASSRTICDLNAVLFAGLKRWHERLGHGHTESVQIMHRRHVVEGMQTDSETISENCVSCMFGKRWRQPIPKTCRICSKRALALIYSDVCMLPEASLGGSKDFCILY